MSAATGMEGPRIVIAGGGLAGLSLALALKKALGDGIGVVMCDPALRRDPHGDKRSYAIAAAARRMLTALGTWDQIADKAQPILDMVITDSRLQDPVRPTFLTFAGEVDGHEPFAHMITAGDLTAALLEACRENGVDLRPEGVKGFAVQGAHTEIALANGESLPASLLVAADGARSRLREQAGIGWISWPYNQSGIVATIAHERDHEGRAVEHFLPSGPFAILPLKPELQADGNLRHRSSIVWTERADNVPALLDSAPDDLLVELERRFGLQLGKIAFETRPQAFPLSFGVARSFVGERLALLGDAAHVIHPIAGQGLNLGLHDAAALAEIITDALRLGMDPGAADVLDQYERARRADITAMGLMTDGLNRLFSNDVLPVRLIRDLGLGLVDRMPGLKRFFIREAAGLRADEAPRLLRGEAL
ncbi:ubiquinone biosynthesis hydroxylase [Microvirga lotononidis]|uniref:Ubiquinone biosynthesis hydroxylase, UbiH/UbiF/VisC/COQ6 family n=1 Tax=Microvirga lotononidis TaxID=864069 RepID=I4YYX4_9HYPH|nr:ubiquinone biosynthesis hydroxylase [Microvirga lotononidis]EIM29166.1 Ubiquinone biosynthesis hydroxylase, UbiH/UbiF/VisC/COQ6 family [Microvirga lotononidis]WQO29006.1 ubiquinone biosynthesis hydroxylase [Microvirga lotononidis]